MGAMAERLVSQDREQALVELLEDPSPVVQKALLEEFGRLGGGGVAILRKVLREAKGERRTHADRILGQLAGPDPARQFVDFIRSLRYELETGLLLINRVVFPELDIAAVSRRLDVLAQRCREIGVPPMAPRQQCKLLNRVLFHEYGFRGNTEDYEDPLNSCIEAVLRRRKGLPVTLSAVYILVGQRLGLELEPIGLPGHFLVGCFQGSQPLYIDPFERGRFRTVEEIREILIRHHVAPEFHHLAPLPVGEVLCRVCRNLVGHFETRGQPGWAARFRGFVREFEDTRRRQSRT